MSRKIGKAVKVWVHLLTWHLYFSWASGIQHPYSIVSGQCKTPVHAELIFWCCLVIWIQWCILLHAAICICMWVCRVGVSSRRAGWVEGEENIIFLCLWQVSMSGSPWLDGVCYLWSSGCWRNAVAASSARVSHSSAWKRHYPHLFLPGIRDVHSPPRLNLLFILIFFSRSLLKDSALPVVPLFPASFASKDMEWQSPDPSLRSLLAHPNGRGNFSVVIQLLLSLFSKGKGGKMGTSSKRRTTIFFITVFSELSLSYLPLRCLETSWCLRAGWAVQWGVCSQ